MSALFVLTRTHLKSLLVLFYTYTGQWFSPETTGVRPPPCAAFTFIKVDYSRVVLFGGRQLEERVNHVHILDMSNWVC